jgi:dTMP kinase
LRGGATHERSSKRGPEGSVTKGLPIIDMTASPAPVAECHHAMNALQRLAGCLIAFEGIDQAGKRTICDRLAGALRSAGVPTEQTGFPDYTTPLGREIGRFLGSQRDYPVEVRQLLYTANRWERAPEIRAWLARGRAVVLDRYLASGIAYGAAQGLEADWMACVERGLPPADLTILLDIPPEVSLSRKSVDRDAYEARTDLLVRARAAYLDLAHDPSWRVVDASRERESVWAAVKLAIDQFAAAR